MVYNKLLTFKPVKIKRKNNCVVGYLRKKYGAKIDSLGDGRYVMLGRPVIVEKTGRKPRKFPIPIPASPLNKEVQKYVDEAEVQEKASMMIITILQVLTLLGQFILAIAYIVK